METERRRSTRMSVEGEGATALLHAGSASIPVLIADESVYGVGVVAVNLHPRIIFQNDEVRFESPIRTVTGRVACIQSDESLGTKICKLGLEWVR